jgi:hypothetical protein
MDLGCYCGNGAPMLAGEPEVLFGKQVLGETGVDLFAGLLRFSADVLAEIDCAFEMPYGSGLEALGSEGSARPKPLDVPDPAIVLRRGDIRRPTVSCPAPLLRFPRGRSPRPRRPAGR